MIMLLLTRYARSAAITPRKVQGIVDCVTFIETQKFIISATQLSSFIDKAMSTSPVTGNLPRVATRYCQMMVAIAEHWDTPMILDEYCRSKYFSGRTMSIYAIFKLKLLCFPQTSKTNFLRC